MKLEVKNGTQIDLQGNNSEIGAIAVIHFAVIGAAAQY